MKKNIIIFWTLALLLIICACSEDREEKKLLNKVHEQLTLTKKEKVSRSSHTIEQYKDIEFQMNKDFVKSLKAQPAISFERQIERFDDNELGVIQSYRNMFAYIIESDDEWNDEMQLKSNKYFNTLEIDNDIQFLYERYKTDLKNIRERFIRENKALPNWKTVHLPERQISLASFGTHTRNNIAIEIATEIIQPILAWLVGLMLVQILVFIFNRTIGSQGCIVDIIVFVIITIISIWLSIKNDNHLKEALRNENNERFNFDNGKILNQLNNNTIKFYEAYK